MNRMIPNWISYVLTTDSYNTHLKPCKCERCEFVWYPRITVNGDININTCPKCKSKLWNKIKISKSR